MSKQRAEGSGSIEDRRSTRRRRPKGLRQKGRSYYWRYRKEGKEFWVPLGGEEKAARARLRELQSVGPQLRTEMKLAELAASWLTLCVAAGRNPKNQVLAELRVTRYLTRFFGPVRAADLRPESIRLYRRWLEQKGLAPATVRAILGDLRTCLRWAAGEGWLVRSPFPPKLLPVLEERPPDRLTEAEVETLVGLEEPFGYVVRVALCTGLRWGELTALRAEDYRDGVFVVRRTKNKKVRRVPAPASVVAGRVGLLVGPWDPGGFARAVRRRTGIARFHCHMLRHTFACRWLEAGGSLAALQDMLGHSSIVVTQRYARLSEGHVRAEAARVAARLGWEGENGGKLEGSRRVSGDGG